jgi:serine/threonine-protein kinase RsbT
MQSTKVETLPIKTSADVVVVRQLVRQRTAELRFGLVDQTKMVTAASELARNTLDHGKGGQCTVENVINGTRVGLRLVFEDEGPGIPDVELALKDGYTTGSGLGLGLGGSRRLVSEFDIQTVPGKGTKITVVRWK